MDESLASAAQRMKSAQTNFITAPSAYIESVSESESDSDDDQILAVTRAEKKTTDLRKGFQGVFPPARKKHADSHPRTKDQMPKATSPTKGKHTDIPTPPQTPVDIPSVPIDPNDSDMLIEDEPMPTPTERTSQASANHLPPQHPPNPLPQPAKHNPRRSDVQNQVDQMGVLSRILNQPVTLAVGEVFGISKDLTNHLHHVLKPKAMNVPPSVQANIIDMGANP